MHSAPPITVWIHGTKLEKLLPNRFAAINIDRFHKFMHNEQGLHLAKNLDPSFHHYKIAHALHAASVEQFPWDTFYIFGWSGKLHHAERQKAAAKLHKALSAIVREYEGMYHQKPYLRVICHSHGGNIALNLALYDDSIHHLYHINELILLACPVQKVTAPMLKHPLFQKIYSIHSHWDFVQIADPQGWHAIKQDISQLFANGSLEQVKTLYKRMEEEPFFSERHFNPSSKLLQVRVKMNGLNLMHIQFMLLPFVELLPQIIELLHQIDDRTTSHNAELFLEIKNGVMHLS